MEMKLQQISAFAIAGGLFYSGLGLLSIAIKSFPDPLQQVWGHAPKCIFLSTGYFILCLLMSSIIKHIFYRILGIFLGMQPTTPMDDFWLYDYPINPICVPSIITFDRPKNGTIEQ